MGMCELRQEGGNGVLALSGDFTVAEAGEFKESLAQALAACQELAVDLAGVERVDLTFLQLLRAVHVSLAQRGASLECAGAVPPPVVNAAEQAGFLIGVSDYLFWKRGK